DPHPECSGDPQGREDQCSPRLRREHLEHDSDPRRVAVPERLVRRGGSRYGNVEFRFDWSSIAGAGQAWWVGSMGYTPQAARILITDRTPDASLQLMPYDPNVPGPWERRAPGRDLWNYEICVEILAERDLSLDAVTELRCVGHHH